MRADSATVQGFPRVFHAGAKVSVLAAATLLLALSASDVTAQEKTDSQSGISSADVEADSWYWGLGIGFLIEMQWTHNFWNSMEIDGQDKIDLGDRDFSVDYFGILAGTAVMF